MWMQAEKNGHKLCVEIYSVVVFFSYLVAPARPQLMSVKPEN